ncbi:hypothetical protein KDK_70540 [Dictyobacter kobayashii]|uniref:Uncharacterized protein n=2 Tax=Dictyobacter kobayashii TaxID=2014872 RepID=A0A402AW04_9CHLR|nr:hypothetical protein KDK_70540 [Dictyobacter kobayashii]
MVLPDALLIVDKFGDIHRKENWLASDKTGDVLATIAAPDDSGFSPNLTYNGLPVLSAVAGDVYVFKQNLWHEIGVYGLDVVTPAVYPDNSLAIAGYAGTGFCRVSLDGKTQWTTQIKRADKLPTINNEHIAAIGSADGFSAFFRSDGEQIGEYKQWATFAEYIDGGWIALSKQRLARLTKDGREIWGCDIHRSGNLTFVEQPIVDRDGFIFVRNQEGYQCYAPQGHITFEVKLPAIPQGLMSIIAPHTMAYVIENELFIGYN